ncbi:MAG TPA: metallophosphoesterase family protein [Blastocatellia bacterium]|nr:metallophosphoesterase family protein [Blastocatellia bacterium]
MRLGVISDTHGLFDDRVATIFAGVDRIIHAGDIGKLEVIKRLEQIAPVIAVEGNNDWFGQFPTERVEEFDGQRVMIRHIFGELHQLEATDKKLVAKLQPNIVIFGHSHRPYNEMLDSTMLFNPGSAGPRRFSLPRTVGLLTIHESQAEAQIISLD